jgi:hypothetical protein
MRRFVILDRGGSPIALLDFHPIFEDGILKGYTAAFKRKLVGTTPMQRLVSRNSQQAFS